jgi:hypothetical protein
MARVLKGNKRLIGKSGAFNGMPSNLKQFGVTADSAAIIPSQFGLTKTQMKPVIEQISGELMNGTKFKFARVGDVIDDRNIRRGNSWNVQQFQEHVMSDARKANGGQPTFV